MIHKTSRLSLNWKKYIFICLLPGLAIMTGACGEGPTEADHPSNKNPEAAGNSDFLSASTVLEDAATPAPGETPEPTPIPEPTRTRENVLSTWGHEDNLDALHVNVTSKCTKCHTQPYAERFAKAACSACHTAVVPNGPVRMPSDRDCLSCHGGTYGGVGNLTRNLDPNPHDYHYTSAVQCNFCHVMHEPAPNPCALCHSAENYTITK